MPEQTQTKRYRKKPVVIEAHQWFKNGDHPGDNCHMVTPEPDSVTQFEPFLSEGEVVRYYRHPDVPGDTPCRQGCGHQMHYHGWIDTPEGGSDGAQVVCPGDWIITGVKGEYYPCKPDVFEATYEPVTQHQERQHMPEQMTESVSAVIAGSAKSLAQMQAEITEVNLALGWHDKPVSFGEAMALLHSEVSEALDAWRHWEFEDATTPRVYMPGGKLGPPPKPEGVGSEFADVLIRLMDACERFGVDLAAEYERKIAYNRTRPYRHGGKRI